MRLATPRSAVRPFGAFGVGVVGGAVLALAACSSASNAGTPDTGGVVIPEPDTGTTELDGGDATVLGQHDALSIFGEDTGTVPPPPTVDAQPADATGAPDGAASDAKDDGTKAADASGTPDAPLSSADSGHDATSSSPDAGSADAAAGDAGQGTGQDTGPKDTGTSCTVVPVQVGSGMGLGQCSSPVTGTCGPGSLVGFTATAPPPTAPESKCTTAETQAVYDGCLGPDSSSAGCTATNDLCYDCIFSDQTDPTWGPLVSSGGLVNLNVGGCISLLEPCNAACADTYENDLQCEEFACGTNCPVSDSASVTAYDNCAASIDDCAPKGCYSYSSATQCSQAITGPSHPASVCLTSQSDFEAAFLAIVPVFCGN